VYGLRDEHSRHEFDFTPTLYDARYILDWNGEMRKLEEEGSLGTKYKDGTMSSTSSLPIRLPRRHIS